MNCVYIRPICKRRVFIFQTKKVNVCVLPTLQILSRVPTAGILIALQTTSKILSKKESITGPSPRTFKAETLEGNSRLSVYCKTFAGDVQSGLNCWPRVTTYLSELGSISTAFYCWHSPAYTCSATVPSIFPVSNSFSTCS